MSFSSPGKSAAPAKPCYDRAMDLLARRPHFQRELQFKLRQRGYEDADIEGALEKLMQRGFVNDSETARAFVRQRLGRGPIGRRKLVAELERRGVESSAVAAVLDAMVPDDETPTALEATDSWLRRRRRERWDRGALARHLQGKGFAPRAIVAALDLLHRHLEDSDLEIGDR